MIPDRNLVPLKDPQDVLVDPSPDERGNVVIAATFVGGRMIALEFNAN
jgi:hypothetical protein